MISEQRNGQNIKQIDRALDVCDMLAFVSTYSHKQLRTPAALTSLQGDIGTWSSKNQIEV
jgi:hypothetical protein